MARSFFHHRLLLAVALAGLLCPAGLRAQSAAVPHAGERAGVQSRYVKKAEKEYTAARRAEDAGNWSAAFEGYVRAAADDPRNTDYRLRRELARFQLVQEHMDRAEGDAVAGQFEPARQELETALALDPSYAVARERLEQIESLEQRLPAGLSTTIEGAVELQPAPGTRNFDYRGDTRGAYEEVARQFELTATFDADLRSPPVRFRVKDVDFWTAMRLLADMTGTFWRPVNSRLFLVAQDTPQKRHDYELSVLRTVVLPESETSDEMTETLRLVREIAGITRAQLDLASRTLTLRASPQQIFLALELVQQAEQSRGQLMLEIEILEVDRKVARQLGLTPPSSARIFTISPSDIREAQQSAQGFLDVLNRLFGQPSSLAGLAPGQIGALVGSGQIGLSTLLPPLVAFGGGRTTFLATLPGTTAEFAEALSLVRHGQRVLLRVEDGRPATFFVGDRFPVSLATLSPSLGAPRFIPQVSTGNFPRTDLMAGTAPVSVAVGDFNGDGKPDLVAADQAANTVSVFLNTGNGTFSAKTDFPTGAMPTAVVTGDFNGDAHVDLAVANQQDNTISILIGNGDGTFGPKTNIPAGNGPVAIATGDFNGDGKLDLAVANKGANTVSIFLGKGDGTFQPKVDYPTGAGPISVVAADFNGDGKLDLAVADQTGNTVSILLGKGDGTFGPKTDFATGTGPASVIAADFNADKNIDLAVANETDNTVSILLGNGGGTFQAKNDFNTGAGPVSVASADFNSDGFPDLAVADQAGNAISILINNGSGGFGFKLDVPTGVGPASIVAADLNGDGRPDAATANQSANTVSVILNSTMFVSGPGTTLTAYPSAEFVDLGLKVKATPRLHPDGEVTLKLDFQIRSLAGDQINGIPVISNRTIEQTVRLRENQTSALAGILQPQESLLLTGWPGVERLIGQQNKTQADTELLILATPRLIRIAPRVNRTFYAGREPGRTAGPLPFPRFPQPRQ